MAAFPLHLAYCYCATIFICFPFGERHERLSMVLGCCPYSIYDRHRHFALDWSVDRLAGCERLLLDHPGFGLACGFDEQFS